MRRFPPLGLLILLSLGCAHSAIRGPGAPALSARGPGSVFRSIPAAAVDALTYAHLQGRSDASVKRLRAGTIDTVPGGYSYAEVRTASLRAPHRVRLDLSRRTVAHFHVYTRAVYTGDAHLLNRIRERPSRRCARLVDVVDPLHRPAFILTPSLRVRAYHGRDVGLVEIADLKAPASPRVLARQMVPAR